MSSAFLRSCPLFPCPNRSSINCYTITNCDLDWRIHGYYDNESKFAWKTQGLMNNVLLERKAALCSITQEKLLRLPVLLLA